MAEEALAAQQAEDARRQPRVKLPPNYRPRLPGEVEEHVCVRVYVKKGAS